MTHTSLCKYCGNPTERVNNVPATCFECKKKQQLLRQRTHAERRKIAEAIRYQNSKV